MRVAETDPRIGCVGPKTYDYWQRERIFSAGGIIQFRESVTREMTVPVDRLDKEFFELAAAEVVRLYGEKALGAYIISKTATLSDILEPLVLVAGVVRHEVDKHAQL